MEFDRSAYATRAEHREATEMFRQNRTILEEIPVGYYAVRIGDTDSFDFLRVSHPKTRRLLGALQVQTQHSDMLVSALLDWNLTRSEWDTRSFTLFRPYVVKVMLELAPQIHQAMMKYAEIHVRCCRCNKKLTDVRSRWFGFGPECEKMMENMYFWVRLTKGEFEDREIEIDD